MAPPSLGDFLRLARKTALAYFSGNRAKLQHAQRSMAFALLQGQAEELVFQYHDTTWTVAVGDSSISRSLFMRRPRMQREPEAVLNWLESQGRFAAPRRFIIDVGANIGAPSLFLAQRKDVRILAVEPMPKNFRLLVKNVRDNNLDHRITCVNAAISSSPGTLTMLDHPASGQCEVRTESGLQGFGTPTKQHQPVKVEACPLDALLPVHRIPPAEVAMVWSDTQGFEGEVIQSGVSLWSASVPLFLEVWPPGLAAHGGVERFLDIAQKHFRTMLSLQDLRTDGTAGRPRPISDLCKLTRSIEHGHTDVLLLPAQ